MNEPSHPAPPPAENCLIVCPKCGGYRVESRVQLVNPQNGKPQFRATDMSLPILLIFIAAIIYAAVDGLFSPSRVDQAFGTVFLLLFLLTVASLLYSYITRDHFVEMLRHTCLECKHRWNVHLPEHSTGGHVHASGGETKNHG